MGSGVVGDSPKSTVAKAIGSGKGGGGAGSDSPAQPRSPGFLSISPPRGSSFPGPLHVKASDPSTVRVSGTVRGSPARAWLGSPAQPPGLASRWAVLPAPRPEDTIGGEVSGRRGLAGLRGLDSSRRPGGGAEAGPAGRRAGRLGPGPELRAVALFSSAEPRREWGLRLGPWARPTRQRPGAQIQAPSSSDAHHTSPELPPRTAKSARCGATARPRRSRSPWPASPSKYREQGRGCWEAGRTGHRRPGASPEVREAPGRCQRLACLAGGQRRRSWGARREEGAWPGPVTVRWAQGLGAPAHRVSLSRCPWNGERERG